MDSSIRTSFLTLLVAFLVVLGTGSIVAKMNHKETENSITARTISATNNNVIRMPHSYQPAPSTVEGTIIIQTKPPVEVFGQLSDAREYIIFYSATNLPGVRIVYNIQDRRFEAGSPLLVSPEIDIFDQQIHQLVYTFRREGEQAIFLDGIRVDSSDFNPIAISKISGFAFIEEETADKVDISGIGLSLHDRVLEPDQMNQEVEGQN